MPLLAAACILKTGRKPKTWTSLTSATKTSAERWETSFKNWVQHHENDNKSFCDLCAQAPNMPHMT
jgi:hypothetical protein